MIRGTGARRYNTAPRKKETRLGTNKERQGEWLGGDSFSHLMQIHWKRPQGGLCFHLAVRERAGTGLEDIQAAAYR